MPTPPLRDAGGEINVSKDGAQPGADLLWAPKHKISKTTPCKVEMDPGRGHSGRSRPGHERSVVTARTERRSERRTSCFHHVINGERCSQASARSWFRTNLATFSHDIVPPWKLERSVSARMESRPGLSFNMDGRTRTQSRPLSLTIASCRFLSAYTLRRRSGKIRLLASYIRG